jgi:phosphoserine aminotransferase
LQAAKYGTVNMIVNTSRDTPAYTTIPARSEWKATSVTPSYIYYCANETVHGVELHTIPEGFGDVPIVGDFSSSFMSHPIGGCVRMCVAIIVCFGVHNYFCVDISKFGVIFAGAQKNIGPAGVVVVIGMC